MIFPWNKYLCYVVSHYCVVVRLHWRKSFKFSQKLGRFPGRLDWAGRWKEGCNTAAWSWTISVGPRGWETQPSVNIIMKLEQEQMVQSYERTHATSSVLSSSDFPPVSAATVKENYKYNSDKTGRGKYRNIIFFFTNFPQSAGKSA